jgi:hypothetical protein
MMSTFLLLCVGCNCSIITTMEHRTIKIWKSTYHNLRLLAALTGETMLAVLARLVADELERVQHERNSEDKQ